MINPFEHEIVKAVGLCKECGVFRGYWAEDLDPNGKWHTMHKCQCGLRNVIRIDRNDGVIWVTEEYPALTKVRDGLRRCSVCQYEIHKTREGDVDTMTEGYCPRCQDNTIHKWHWQSRDGSMFVTEEW